MIQSEGPNLMSVVTEYVEKVWSGCRGRCRGTERRTLRAHTSVQSRFSQIDPRLGSEPDMGSLFAASRPLLSARLLHSKHLPYWPDISAVVGVS